MFLFYFLRKSLYFEWDKSAHSLFSKPHPPEWPLGKQTQKFRSRFSPANLSSSLPSSPTPPPRLWFSLTTPQHGGGWADLSRCHLPELCPVIYGQVCQLPANCNVDLTSHPYCVGGATARGVNMISFTFSPSSAQTLTLNPTVGVICFQQAVNIETSV